VPIGDGDTPSFPFGSWGFFADPPSPRLRRDKGSDDGNGRSFITRDFNRGLGKENGTIPFSGSFLKKVFIRKFRQLARITKGAGVRRRLIFKCLPLTPALSPFGGERGQT